MVIDKLGQWKIQQMAFMVLAVFIFFVLVGLFFLTWSSRDVRNSYEELEKEQAISSLKVITDMAEFNCDSRESLCVDKDKLRIMRGNRSLNYAEFFEVESIEFYVLGNSSERFLIYDSGQSEQKKYSTYVSICEKDSLGGYVYDNCDIGKVLVGVKLVDE